MNYLPPFLLWFLRLATLALVVVTLLPFLQVGWWFVRVWDFPRLQLSILMGAAILLAMLVVYFSRGPWLWEPWLLAGCLLLAGGWQLAHVLPFTRVWPKQLTEVKSGDSAQEKSQAKVTRIGVMNLKFDNPELAQAAKVILGMSLDHVLLVEYDQAWAERLSELKQTYPHKAGVEKGEGMGIMLFSREPIEEWEVRYVVSERRPSVWAKVALKQGGHARFVGVHPTPPGLKEDSGDDRRDSRERDAELLMIAKEIAQEPDANWLVAGDLNDVAWSHTTRLFMRVSGLKDPRVGRALLNSFNAQSYMFRYPLDHVFMSSQFNVANLRRHYIPGSDHFAIMADVLLVNKKGELPSADGEDHEDTGEIIEEGKQDAREHGVAN